MQNVPLSSRQQALKVRHKALDEQLHAEMQRPLPNELEIARLKREKLKMKDKLTH